MKIFSDLNMLKDRPTLGINLRTDSLKMSVELGGALNTPSCLKVIEENWPSILNKCGFSPEDVTCITLGGHTKPITIVTFYAQKKTPEKNGVQ